MHVSRIGSTPVKGGRHQAQASVTLAATGPVGDRVFCLVDAGAGRCLRTVEHPTLLRTVATWDASVLSVDLPTGAASGEPVPTGERLEVDYWGRTVSVDLVDGPWGEAFSSFLGRPVLLARTEPGAIVYGDAVTLVSRASLSRLAEVVGAPVDGARFRSTFEVAGDDLAPLAEQGWIGRRLRIGDAEVRVRTAVPRCAVVDLGPASGVRDLPVLKALASLHRADGELVFGVDAEVTVPGRVATSDPVVLSDS